MIGDFFNSNLIPHGYCLSWQPELIAALVIGNLLIALAYFTIPFVILKFIRQRKDIDFQHLHWLFAGFIVTCGVTHLLHVMELWYPVYYLEAVMDIVTAVVSIVAAILLWRLLPQVVELPSAKQLQQMNDELTQLGNELLGKQVQLRNLGDSLPDSFLYQYCIEEERAKFLFVSSGVERLNGVNANLVLQDAMVLLGQIEPAQRAMYAEASAVSQRDLSNFSMELHMLRPDGEWRWLQVRSSPHKRDDGIVVWDGIATDITDQHLFETEINRLAQAIEQNPTGIVITNLQGRLEYMNAACTRITGYQFSDFYLSGRSARETISTEMSETDFGVVQSQLQAGKTWSGVLQTRHKSGRLYWEQITVSPIYDNRGNIVSYLYLRADVSEQKNAEADLKLRTGELERANADLTRFADVSAHHLMEPTRRLTSYAQQLRLQLTVLPEVCCNEEIHASLEYIEHDAGRLRIMVRDVQLYLAAASARGEICTVDVNEVLSAIRQRLSAQFEAQHVTLDIADLPPAILDRPRLMDLFTLLLDNALRYGQPADANVPAHISIAGEREEGLSRYRLSDNGCGIPAQYLERVFEIFERLSMTNREGGTGIGLSIARRIVESRHGKIWLENIPQGGLMVVFELPDGE